MLFDFTNNVKTRHISAIYKGDFDFNELLSPLYLSKQAELFQQSQIKSYEVKLNVENVEEQKI